jgi:protein SCO1/2
LSRRRLLQAVAGATAASLVAVRLSALELASNTQHGRVDPPLQLPSLRLRCAGGGVSDLASLTRGFATAAHLMFTACSSTCPIQGAIFQRVQSLLPQNRACQARLLSISIDPQDTPRKLSVWLARFGARPGWTAAVPASTDMPQILQLFGLGRTDISDHATQVQIIDRSARLIWRTGALPPPESVVDILLRMTAKMT